MDLLVIGSQEARNSSKRVRRNGEGKTDLLCSKWFLTRHCLLRTVLTFSHTSWSHYSKVFFVKGKGGKRASRFSSAVCGRAPPERPKERQQEESRGQNDREKREGEENERGREREVVRKQNCEEHPHADNRKKNWSQDKTRDDFSEFWCHVVLWRILNGGSLFIVFVVIPIASRSYEDCTLFQASIILKCGIASFLVCAYLPPVLFQIRTWSFVCASMVF